jgi:hypothetical protein
LRLMPSSSSSSSPLLVASATASLHLAEQPPRVAPRLLHPSLLREFVHLPPPKDRGSPHAPPISRSGSSRDSNQPIRPLRRVLGASCWRQVLGVRGGFPMAGDEVIRIMCPNLGCQRVLAVPSSARGKLVRCRGCGSNIRIPVPRAESPSAPQAAQPQQQKPAA